MEKATEIKTETLTAINRILEFKLKYDLHEYIIDQKAKNYRELESELSIENPIKVCGIVVNQVILKKWEPSSESLFNEDEDIGADDITDDIHGIPIGSLSLLYIFTILEDFGNTIVGIVNPDLAIKEPKRMSWHHYVAAKNTKEVNLREVQKVFETKKDFINASTLDHFCEIKNQRNAIAHNGTSFHDFSDKYKYVIQVILEIYYLVTDDKDDLKIFPFPDIWERYD